MVRILLADDHAVVRRGLKQILAEEFKEVKFGEAENAQETIQRVLERDWEVALLDISMPGKGGLDVLHELGRLRPKLPVLILSVQPEEQYARRVLKAGAAGYLSKDSAPEEIVKAIRKALAGGRYVSGPLAEKLAWDLEADTEKPCHETLSDREFQVLLMIACGKTLTQIADLLALSVKTVSTYRTRILEKMKMKTNAELTRYALQNRQVD